VMVAQILALVLRACTVYSMSYFDQDSTWMHATPQFI
jgi:hypothetical protein